MSGPDGNGGPAPKKPRAKKASTGRPRGRPPKRNSLLVPSELRRTLLAVLDENIDIRTPKGVSSVSQFEGVIRSLVANALKGNPTSLNHLMRLLIPALEGRVAAHRQVFVAEFMREQSESPSPMGPATYEDVRVQVNFAKNLY